MKTINSFHCHFWSLMLVFLVRSVSAQSPWDENGNTVGTIKYIGTNDNYDFPIYTNGNQSMIVTSNGNVGIGRGTPTTPLNKLLVQNGSIWNPYTLLSNFSLPSSQAGIISTSNTNGDDNAGLVGLAVNDQALYTDYRNIGVLGVAFGNNVKNWGIRAFAHGDGSINTAITASAAGVSEANCGILCHVEGSTDRNEGIIVEAFSGAEYNKGLFAETSGAYDENISVDAYAHDSTPTNIGFRGRAEDGVVNIGIYTSVPTASGPSGSLNGGTPGSDLAGYFNGDILCTNTYYYSDAKLKENIHEYNGALQQLDKISVKQYSFKAEQFPTLNMPQGTQIGVLSKEIKQVFPGMVKLVVCPGMNKDMPDIEFESVNYNALVPVLVQAVKELYATSKDKVNLEKTVVQQNAVIEQMKVQLQILSDCVAQICSDKELSKSDTQDNYTQLYQNMPNPVSNETIVKYYIAKPYHKAYILFTDGNGNSIREIGISEKGEGHVIVGSELLTSGLVNYSLVVDGRVISTKTITVIK